MMDNMLIFIPLCLLFGWMLPTHAMRIRFSVIQRDTVQDIPLNTAEDSVDDMYLGCQGEMMKKVKTYDLENEMKNENFAKAWEGATECAQKEPMKEDRALTKDHMQAICVYTDDLVYSEFNNAVRTKGNEYGSTFGFHSLHFLLTSAIQILNSNHHCHNTYRRTKKTFIGKVGDRFRFGSFASSSYLTDLTDFGHETCFKIKTCSGAYLKYYSTFCDKEKEVLIPPYEMFKITEKIVGQGKYKELEDCKVVYVVESVGVKSNLNCKVALL